MQELRQRRENLERELQQERRRVYVYQPSRMSYSPAILPIVIMVPIMLLLFTQVLPSITSINCDSLLNTTKTSNNATITSWQQLCKSHKSQVDGLSVFLPVVMIIIVAIIILFVIRLI